jgi:hypothetical protein
LIKAALDSSSFAFAIQKIYSAFLTSILFHVCLRKGCLMFSLLFLKP